VLLGINVTSISFNGIVLVSQCIASPVQMPVIGGIYYLQYRSNLDKAITIIPGILNLNFFGSVYSPFCLHPQLNIMEVLSLDYIVALYPFLLILITYILITAYDRGWKLLIWMWKPFKMCTGRYRQMWNIQTSLVEIFASFILLSCVKILGVSSIILTSAPVYDLTGEVKFSTYAYGDANIEYFGTKHLPYALLAIAISLVFVVLPLLLLAVYPCGCFHRCLDRCGLRLRVLHVFMDAFQGSYRTQPQDMRYFSTYYLLLRILMLAQTQIFLSEFMYYSCAVLSFLSAALVTVFQPYRKKIYNQTDSVLLTAMGIYFACFREDTLRPSNTNWIIIVVLQAVSIAVIHIYFIALMLWKLVLSKIPAMKRQVNKAMKAVTSGGNNGAELDEDHQHEQSYPALLTQRGTYGF